MVVPLHFHNQELISDRLNVLQPTISRISRLLWASRGRFHHLRSFRYVVHSVSWRIGPLLVLNVHISLSLLQIESPCCLYFVCRVVVL
jgi:hypothetical protein